MAIDTKTQETLKSNNNSIKIMRRGDSPESSCQLPTAPAHSCLIPLTQGKVAIIDSENYEWLNQWKWYASDKNYGGYIAVRTINRKKKIRMHRLIMNCPDDKQIDHINHRINDNRKCNLRICTHTQNLQNQLSRGGKSVFKGITYSYPNRKWVARIQLNKRRIFLGSFNTEIDAAKAYDTKALELFGEFAYINF